MDIRKLSPELAKKAQDDLGENYDRLQSDINTLRCWIDKQNDLISRNDDQFLLSFLRRCNFNLEECKTRIDSYLTCKSINPDLFKNRPVDATALEILKCGLITIPPHPLPNNGPRLLISHFSKFDPKKYKFRDIIKVRYMLFEILAFKDDLASISGVELIFDLKNCSLQQAFNLEPGALRKALYYQEQCLPLRIKSIHIINMKKELQSIVRLARSIVSTSKEAIQILVHEKESDLYKYIPQESMSAEYGGTNGSPEDILQEWERILLDHVEYFEKDALFGINEKLRKEKSNSSKNNFGIEGNFKKLELD